MQYGSFINSISGTDPNYVPQVGDGVTFLHWSDRSPGTVSRVSKSGKSIWVQPDNYKIISGSEYDGSAQYEIWRNPEAREIEFTKRKNGQWIRKGSGMKSGQRIAIGYRSVYHDPHF